MSEKKITIQDFSKTPDKLKHAFECIYKQHLHVLCLAAFKILSDREKSKDCVQDVFVELWQKNKVPQLLQLEDVGAYLFTCVQHKCFHILARENRQEKNIEQLVIEDKSTATPYEKADEQPEDIFLKAVQDMPPQSYKAFKLHVIDGKRRKEVADVMGVSINTVKTHLKIAFRIARNNIVKSSKNIHPQS